MPAIAALFVTVLATQASSSPPYSPPVSPSPIAGVRTTAAVRASVPPVIDGRDDDEIWRSAPVISEFREFQPTEDKDPRFQTEARVAYDSRHFYVFIRAFDPNPDSILTLLSRRDVRSASDQLKIIIDSYHDRRTGYEFAVNPAGVKRDYAVFDDNNEDDAWDAVWEVGTQIDSLGWTAEFRIPLSQLRYAPGASNTFGFGVWRDIQRTGERVSWPLYRPSQSGLMSQIGEVAGLEGLAAPSRLEVSPYGVAKNLTLPTTTGFARDQQFTVGADIKYGLTSNLTLDATVNPDFGQVEADPSVLNLSTFETFLQERRPFFVSGTGIFSFNVNCSQVNCSGENLFYSRRVGRAPTDQLVAAYGDASSPTATTIIGAAKLTGRFPGGMTIGFLDAVTRREEGTLGRTIEPTTNYAAVRATQDLNGGESGFGLMLTGVNRSLDQWTESSLRSSAYAGALDFRHRFSKGRYRVSGKVGFSRVAGTDSAIAGTQRSSVHNFQRPDDDLVYDSSRTSLTGSDYELYFGKVGGGLIRFETSVRRRSPGFETNDLGFLRSADQQNWDNWMGLQFNKPAHFYRMAFWNFNWWQAWTTGDGLSLERAANTNAHVQLKNRWWVHAGGTKLVGQNFCDRCARGGPAVRLEPWVSMWGGIESDDRLVIRPFLWFNYWRGDGGRSHSTNISPDLGIRIASRFNGSVGLDISHYVDDWGWMGNVDTLGTTHYTFGHLDQRTVSMRARLDYTVSTTLTVQLYASPFVSKGEYTNFRELSATPRAASYDARFQPYGTPGAVSGFNFQQFRSNLVMRWEYRPGSTLFLVYGQGHEDFDPAMGNRSMGRDFRNLFDTHPNTSFLIKASYWLNW